MFGSKCIYCYMLICTWIVIYKLVIILIVQVVTAISIVFITFAVTSETKIIYAI